MRVLTVGIAVVTALVSTAQAQDVVAKVMSFNIRTSQAAGDAGARCSNWAGERKGNVASQITTVGPDFVGTQETSDEQKAFLDGALAASYKSIGTRTGSLNGAASEITAIWYKFTEWEKIVDGTFWFGPNTDAPSAAWNMVYYRTFTYGRFKHIKSGKTICVLNTHYETPGNDLAQNEASKIIIAKTPTLCSGDDKITVLTGDFNALRNYPAMTTLFADGWLETSEEPTFCGDMINPTCQQKFDFTFHKLTPGVCQTKTEVMRTPFAGCYPSDHAVIMATFCLSGSCCGTPDTPTPSPTPSASANTTSSPSAQLIGSRAGSSGSSANDADVKPGVVAPGIGGSSAQLLMSGVGTPGADPGVAPGTAPADASNQAGSGGATPTSGSEKVNQVTTKSEGSTSATGTVFVILGVLSAVGGVCAFVIKKKRALDAKLDGDKSSLAPVSGIFSREEADALSPRQSTSGSTLAARATNFKRAMSRKFSSPVPTLETISEESRSKRSFSQTSSIPCSHRSSAPITPSDFNGSLDRMSSPVMLDDDGRETGRASSRLYFSEVVSDRKGGHNDFALL